MPRLWRNNREPKEEELRSLEEELRAALRPVQADEEFIQRFEEHLLTPRTLGVYQARSWEQSWILLGSITGTLLGLAVLGIWVWWRKKARED